MNSGMLWFDNDPKKSLELKVSQAAEYYQRKYGRKPDMCLVNPASVGQAGETAVSGRIAIRPLRSIMPGHLWIGVEEKLSAAAD